MIVKFPDFDGDTAGIVDRDIPDERIQKFLNWLLTANRYTFENNPDVTLEKVIRLRADLIAECRKAKAPEVKRPDEKPSFEITVDGLLALCDCETVEELVDRVVGSAPAVPAPGEVRVGPSAEESTLTDLVLEV